MCGRQAGGQSSHHSWHVDGMLAGLLLIGLWRLQPVMPDGDGLAHALRAIYSTYLDGIDVKHPLYAALLRALYQLSAVVGLQSHAIALLSLTSHLAAVGIFLLLARCVYPSFMDKTTASLCAAGAVVSFGLLSRSATIEAYAPALCADVASLAFIMTANPQAPLFGVIAGMSFLVALAFHVTNVLMAPLLITLLLIRVGRDRALATLVLFGTTVAVGLVAAVAGLLLARGLPLWPPDLLAVAPRGDPQPPLSLTARLGRTLYGMIRTVAYLPPFRALTPTFGVIYLAAVGSIGLVLLYFAWHGLVRRRSGYVPLLTLLAIGSMPFILMGAYYFPSDPERWLFLLPVVWLVIGLIMDSSRHVRQQTGLQASRLFLILVVVCLALYNVYQLVPQTRVNRDLAGLQALATFVTAGDLVITPAGINSRIYEFFIEPYPSFRNLTITALVDKFGGDQRQLEGELHAQIREVLERGDRVYVHGIMNEGHRRGENYPWAHLTRFDYGPDTFIAMLRRFNLKPVISPTPDATGTFEVVAFDMKRPR